MNTMKTPIIYIPHGGGPMPLLDEPNHQSLVSFLSTTQSQLGQPKAILMISAHWEEDIATVSSGQQPELIYDYYGFPKQSYEINYPAKGSPQLAQKILSMLESKGIEAKPDSNRGFDHGTFVPLKLIFPKADIPVVQLSLVNNLDPQAQINLGKAIGELSNQGVLIIGSGMSFHNLQVLMSKAPEVLEKSKNFDRWLNNVIIGEQLNPQVQEAELVNWANAPDAQFAHPREEHLLPLHVCFGAAQTAGLIAENVFNQELLGAKTSAFLWQ